MRTGDFCGARTGGAYLVSTARRKGYLRDCRTMTFLCREILSTFFPCFYTGVFNCVLFCRSDYRYLAHNYVPHRISFDKIALPAAAALAEDTCFGLLVLNGTLKEALEAEEASAAGAADGASGGKSKAWLPAALRFENKFAQAHLTNGPLQHEPPQPQRHRRHPRRLFPTEAFYHSSCGRVAADPHQLVSGLISGSKCTLILEVMER